MVIMVRRSVSGAGFVWILVDQDRLYGIGYARTAAEAQDAAEIFKRQAERRK